MMICLCGLLSLPGGWSQSEMSLQGMHAVMQSDLYNPAAFHRDGVHIGFPSLLFNMHHTGPGYHQLIRTDRDKSQLQVGQMYRNLRGDNELALDLRLQTFKVKYGTAAWSFGIEHELVSHNSFIYPDELIQLYVDGNQPWIGQQVEIGPHVRIESFHSIGLILSRRFEKVVLGVRPRLLLGQYLGFTARSRVRLDTDATYYQLNLYSDFRYRDVGVLDFTSENLLEYKIGTFKNWRFSSGNKGLALDGGLVWQVNERTAMGLSFTDLGSIKWSNGQRTYESTGDHPYHGITLANITGTNQIDLDGAIDTLRSLLDLSTNTQAFRLSLSPRYFAYYQYQPSRSVSLLLQIQYNRRYLDPVSLALTASSAVTNHLKLGLIFSQRYGYFNAGVMGSLALKKWLGFLTLDNVLNGLDPLSSRRFNARIGLNFHLSGAASFN